MSPVTSRADVFPRRSNSARVTASAASVTSTAVTGPGATRSARSTVIVPGPLPMSSSDRPGRR
jgi:hypothetical protein